MIIRNLENGKVLCKLREKEMDIAKAPRKRTREDFLCVGNNKKNKTWNNNFLLIRGQGY